MPDKLPDPQIEGITMMVEPLTLEATNFRNGKRGDIPRMVEIDEESFEYPWLRADFRQAIDALNIKLVTIDARVVGYVIYDILPAAVQIIRLAVIHDYRRRHVGSQILQHLMADERCRGRAMNIAVRASTLSAHLFMKSQKFHCYKIEPRYFQFDDETTDDAYLFTSAAKTATGKPRGPLTVDLTNRITPYLEKPEKS